MDIDKLIATGLTKNQASAYALLIEKGSISPPEAANKLNLTRTNSYKLLDKLTLLGLAKKSKDMKGIYEINDPTALTSLAADLRAEATTRENAISSIMKDLITKYYTHNEQPAVKIVSGKKLVANAFRDQINIGEDIYFIRSLSDITSMGFDAMHEIRTRPSLLGLNRFVIMPDGNNGPISYENHKRSNLEITWVKNEDYNLPVEWSVTKSSLLIILYANEPHALTISNPLIAGSFLQLWHILSSCLKTMPYYDQLPRRK